MITFEIDGIEYVAYISMEQPEDASAQRFDGPDGQDYWITKPEAA
jgi:hypothetical protein